MTTWAVLLRNFHNPIIHNLSYLLGISSIRPLQGLMPVLLGTYIHVEVSLEMRRDVSFHSKDLYISRRPLGCVCPLKEVTVHFLDLINFKASPWEASIRLRTWQISRHPLGCIRPPKDLANFMASLGMRPST